MKIYLPALALIFIAGCNSTKNTGEMNPNVRSYSIVDPLIVVDGSAAEDVEARLTNEFVGLGQRALSVREIVKWARNDMESKKLIDEAEFGSVLLVAVGDDVNSTTFYQTHSSGSVNSYGNYATYNGTSTSIPMKAVSRDMVANVELRDCKMNEPGTYVRECDLIWQGTTVRHAKGLAFTGTGQMISNTIKGIMKSLDEDGLTAPST